MYNKTKKFHMSIVIIGVTVRDVVHLATEQFLARAKKSGRSTCYEFWYALEMHTYGMLKYKRDFIHNSTRTWHMVKLLFA